MRPRLSRLVLLVAGVGGVLAWARLAAAHDHWLEARPWRATPGQPIAFTLWLGEHFSGAERKPITQPGRYARAELVGATGRRDVRAELVEGAWPVVTLTPGAPGAWVLALDAAPVEIELPADKFNRYLDEEGLEVVKQVRAARHQTEAPGRERYTRSAKTIVQVGAQAGAPVVSAAPTRALGQELEIVPDVDPTALRAGATLGFRVLLRGQPLPRKDVLGAARAGAQVTTRKLRTDASGHASVRLDRAGDWMIRLVHMERSAQAGADWRSYWSSLTFSVEGKGRRAN